MIKISIVDTLPAQLKNKNFSGYRFISTRAMSRSEIAKLKDNYIRRFYLPVLTPKDQEAFFSEFDCFWESLVKGFDKNHLFWRRSVSSKMQEWEHSIGYFLMLLFTLTKLKDKTSHNVLFICHGEQKEIVRSWAKKNNWNITFLKRRKNVFSFDFLRSCFLYFKQIAFLIYKKILSPSIDAQTLKDRFHRSRLMVSFFYPKSLIHRRYVDPFWGELEKHFLKNKQNVIYLSDSLVRLNWNIRKKIQELELKNVFLPYSFLTWKEIFKIAFNASKRIPVLSCDFMGLNISLLVDAFVNKFYCRFAFLAESFYCAVSRICQHAQVEEAFLVFEGNSIERACIQAFKQKSSARIKGYSQGVLYPLNLKIRNAKNEGNFRPEPDIFISTGPYAKSLFLKICNRDENIVREGCSLRYIPKVGEKNFSDKVRHILVALDGINSSVSLLDWICENEDVFKGYRIILRAHPNVPFSQLQSQIINDIPNSFELSDLSLMEDIQRCGCVIYRHSSIGIQALINGKFAIHLAIDSPLSGDPLEELKYGKFVADTPLALESVLKRIKDMPLDEKESHIKKARDFVSSYFAQPTEENVQSFIGIEL